MTYQETVGSADRARELPRVRSISPRDLWDALAKGLDDFWAMPTHVIFLTLIYPMVGVLIGCATFGYNLCRWSSRWQRASRCSARSRRSASTS